MVKITEHFKEKEMMCKCGCNGILYDINLINKLECLRASIGNKPIIINSGYRCKKHNDNVGGAKGSFHLKGKAVDISLKGTVEEQQELIKLADRIFNDAGMGIYKNFIHLDTGPKRRWKG